MSQGSGREWGRAGQEEGKHEVPGHSRAFLSFFFFVNRQPGQNWNRYFLQFLSLPVRGRTWGECCDIFLMGYDIRVL